MLAPRKKRHVFIEIIQFHGKCQAFPLSTEDLCERIDGARNRSAGFPFAEVCSKSADNPAKTQVVFLAVSRRLENMLFCIRGAVQ